MLTAAGEGIRVSGGDIVHCGRVLAAGWCPGTACCSVSGPRRVAATTTVAPVARLLAGTGGCCSVWPGRLQCLCSLQHRHALHYTVATSRVHRTLTSIFRKLGARLLSGCIPQCKLFLKCKSPTHYCQNYKSKFYKWEMGQQFLENVVPSPSPNGSAWAILAQCAWTTRPAHGVQGAQICPQKICKPEKK